MNYVIRLLFCLGLFLAFPASVVLAQNQQKECDLEFDYEVEQPVEGQNGGKVYLIYREGTGPFTIRLYDTLAGIHEFKETKQFNSFTRNVKVLMFDNLEPSNYLIRIENENCKRSLTGLEGITIK